MIKKLIKIVFMNPIQPKIVSFCNKIKEKSNKIGRIVSYTH